MRPFAGLAPLLLVAAAAGAPDLSALLDTLAAHHHASRPDLVDSIAAPAIAEARSEADTSALAALLLARGRTRAAFGMARAAEPDLREALALVEAAADTGARLRSLRWLAVAVGLQGKGAEALRLYRDLDVLAAAAGDSAHLGWARIGRAYDHYLAGAADSASVLYADAAELLTRVGELRGATWARNGQGLAQRQRGDFVGAAASFRGALLLARRDGDALNEATALSCLGRLELQFGDPSLAETMLAQSAAIHRDHRHHREVLVPELEIATARVLAGRPEAATALLDSVQAAAAAHGLVDLEIVAANQLADVLLQLDRPGAAAAACRRTLRRDTWPSAMAATEVRLRLCEALAARDSVRAALAVLDEIDRRGAGAHSLEVQVAAWRGRLLLAVDEPAAARAVLEAFAAGSVDRGGDALRIPLLTALGRARLATGRPEAALAAFAEAVELWDAARSTPADPVWRERRSVDAGDLFAHAVVAQLAEPHDRTPAERQAAAFALLQRYKARTLLERMNDPRRALPPLEAPVTLAQLRGAVLEQGEVLLDLVQGADLAVVFCVTTDTVLTGVLPGARRTAPLIRRLEEALASRAVMDPGPATGLAAGILADLPGAMRERLAAARQIHWSPDGNLHRLPLALLTGAPGWLVPDCAVVRVPAAALLPRLRARGVAAGRGILAVHGLALDGVTPLPGAEAETRWLAARLHGVRRQQGFETLAAENTGWRHAAVLHLAAHVDLNPRQPWQTAVWLGPGPGGRLRASEVATDSVQAELVVLSGCRSAGSDVVGGEGLLGLGAGFLAAGAPAVLATLWDVDDHVTARFVADYYDALTGGETAAEALATARQACRARPESAAPRHWAGFVLVGDGTRQVPVERRGALWPLGLALAAAAAAAVGAGRRGLTM